MSNAGAIYSSLRGAIVNLKYFIKHRHSEPAYLIFQQQRTRGLIDEFYRSDGPTLFPESNVLIDELNALLEEE